MLLKVISTGSQAGNCYALIADNGEILLLDFGCEPNKILRGIDYKVSDVCGACLTHSHGDHVKAYRWILQNGIPIYTNDETAEYFEIISGEKMIGKQEKIPFEVGSYRVTPFCLPHDNTPNFGFLIDLPDDAGRLLYATDFEYLPYTFKSLKINYFLLECNHQADLVDRSEVKYEHSLRGHSELETVKEIIRVNKTPDMRNIILCHLSGEWSDPDRMKSEIQQVAGKWVNVDVAHAGMELKMSKYPF